MPPSERRAWPRFVDRIARGAFGVWLGCFIVLAALWSGLVWTVMYEGRQREAHLDSRVTLQAKGFAEYVALHLQLLDRVLINAREDYGETGAFPSAAQAAPELGSSAPILLEMAITDQTGKLIGATVPSFKGIDVSDRAYFRALAADPGDRLYLDSTTVAGRLSGRVGLPIARPVLSAKGQFRGVVVANMDLAVLRRYFDASDVFEHNGIVAIVGTDDGIVRARFTRDSTTTGEDLSNGPIRKAPPRTDGRSFRIASAFDGRSRLVGLAPVGPYHLRAGVSIPAEKAWNLADGHLLLAITMAASFSVLLILSARSRVRMEAEQLEHIKQLADSRRKEREANQMKSDFLASVSHDLRTPLNSILGFSELIRDEPGGSETGRFAALIHNSAQHLHALVNTLLDLAKIEAGKMEVDLQDVDLHEVLATVAETHRVAGEKKGLTLSLDLAAPGKIIVHTDPTKLVRVLNNVLHNAIKFTDAGKIVVSSFPREDGIVIRVVDSGPGIAEKDLPFVFQSFNSVGCDNPDQHKGSGLGLAVSKSLLAVMGGTIALQSRPGAGTQVDIFLPKGSNGKL